LASARRGTRNSQEAGLGNVQEYLPTRKPRVRRPARTSTLLESETESEFQTAQEESIHAALNSSILGGEENIIDFDSKVEEPEIPDLQTFLDQLDFGEMAGNGSEGSTPPPASRAKSNRAMPTSWSGKHPTFDPEKQASAEKFFREVEMAAEQAGILDKPEEVIAHALSYLDDKVKRKWERLPGAKDPKDFDTWRKAVLKTLPKSSRYELGSMERLEELVRDARRRPIGREEKEAFYDFSLGFMAEADPLSKAGTVSNRDLVVKFLSGLKTVFRDSLAERIIKAAAAAENGEAPARDEEDPYLLKDVVETATKMVDAASVGPFGALTANEEAATYSRGAAASGLSGRGESADYKEIKVKQEEMSEELAKAFTKMDNVEKSISMLTSQFETFSTTIKAAPAAQAAGVPNRYPAPQGMTTRPGMYPKPPGATFNCFYCGQSSHTISQCFALRKDLDAGKIVQRGQTIICNGAPLMRDSPDGTTMKERVDKILAASKQAQVNLLENYQDSVDVEAEYDVMLQGYEAPAGGSDMVYGALDQMRRDQQVFLTRLGQQLKPAGQAVSAPEVPREPTLKDILEQTLAINKRIDVLEQNQLQTRRAAAAASGGEDFQ